MGIQDASPDGIHDERWWEKHRELTAELRRDFFAAEDRLAEARVAAQEARDDVAMAKRSAELEAEWRARQAAAAKAVREAAEAEAAALRLEEEAWEADREEEAREAKRWLEVRRAERERESRELEREIARSQWASSRPEVVRHHAAQVWGAGGEKENAAQPKVFRLIGKSADEVRSLACDVSQLETGTEERVRLNRMQHEMLH